MVARYKIKKLTIEMSEDSSKSHGNKDKVNGSERMYAKKLVKYQLDEFNDKEYLDKEDRFDADMELDLWCYEMGRNDPNYVCRCFEKKSDI